VTLKKTLPLLLLLCILPSGNDLLFSLSVFVQQESADELKPTLDPKSKTGFYIPKDLKDAMRELDRMLSKSIKNKMMFSSERGLLEYHFGLGMWLRNNWGLWHESSLAKYFSKAGVKQPDDMSGIIINCYRRHLNGNEAYDEVIAKYRDAEKEIEKQLKK
jgi:hypothetical protein